MIRFKLRARLEVVHARLDRIIESSCFGAALDLAGFLLIHHAALTAAVPVLERAGASGVFPGWEGRSRLAALEADLAEARIPPHSNADAALAFQTEPEVWGALYALEGSRLGNRVLLRRLAERDDNLARRATRFLAYGLEDAAAWPRFVARLDALNYGGEAFESAVLGAAKVFDVYLVAAERNADPNRR